METYIMKTSMVGLTKWFRFYATPKCMRKCFSKTVEDYNQKQDI